MTLRVGIIGLGGLGRVQQRALNQLSAVSLAGAVDVDPDARNQFEADTDAPSFESTSALLDSVQLDAVTIITPHTLHYDHALACLEAGLHVHLEKPMVTELDQAIELIELADETERLLQIGYQRHFDPRYKAIRRQIQEGTIGTVHQVSCYLAQDWIDPHSGTWRTNPDLSGGGQLFDSGSHLLDSLLWSLDAKPVGVQATMSFDRPGVDVNSALAVDLATEAGSVTASIGVSGDGTDFEESFVAWGTDGHVTYDRESVQLVRPNGDTESVTSADPDYADLTRWKLEAFLEAIRNDLESPVPGTYGLQVTALTRAAYESADSGTRVDPQELIAAARDDGA